MYELFSQDQVHLLMYCSLGVLRDGKAPIHTAKQIQEWFQEHQGEFQHLHGQISSSTWLTTWIAAFLGELKMLKNGSSPSETVDTGRFLLAVVVRLCYLMNNNQNIVV